MNERRPLILSLIYSFLIAYCGVIVLGFLIFKYGIRLSLVSLVFGFLIGKTINKSNINGRSIYGLIAVFICIATIMLGEGLTVLLYNKVEIDMIPIKALSIVNIKLLSMSIFANFDVKTILIYGAALYQTFKLATSNKIIRITNNEEVYE